MDLRQAHIACDVPGSSGARSYLTSVANADGNEPLAPGSYRLLFTGAAGVYCLVRLGAAAVLPTAGNPQTGIWLAPGVPQDLHIGASESAVLHHIATAAGPSPLYITRLQ